jgi:hypothetical protein
LALPPKDNEAFYREVDEELRRAQAAQLARRYGPIVAGLLVLFLLALGGYFWWQHRQEQLAGKQAEELTSIYTEINSGKSKEVAGRLDKLAKDGNSAYRVTALLTKAALASEAGDDAAALAAYKQVYDDKSAAEPYRHLALVRQTIIEYDKLAPAVVIQRLKPLAVAGNPWFGSAGEMVALAYLKQQKPELAAPIFAALAKDDKVPQTIRSRARPMAESLGADIGETGVAGATKE